MKIFSRFTCCALPLLLSQVFSGNAEAQTVTYTFDNLNQIIPDGSALGLSDSRTIDAGFSELEHVSVNLSISGGYNGDLYVQLVHDSGFSVLLNRTGRTTANEFGYDDSGFNLGFSDEAASGDVHGYRTTLFGDEATPLPGPLTGTWAPDGRLTDPGAVLATDPRSALLGSFTGENPSGQWTLFIADLEGGGTGTLTGWGLELTGTVPEPEGIVLLSGGVFAMLRRRRRCQFQAL